MNSITITKKVVNSSKQPNTSQPNTSLPKWFFTGAYLCIGIIAGILLSKK